MVYISQKSTTENLFGAVSLLVRELSLGFFGEDIGEIGVYLINSPGVARLRYLDSASAQNVFSIYALEICSSALYLPFEILCAEIIHCLCHIYNDLLKIKDTSGSGYYYHNKSFRKTAEKHGLLCEHGKYGWSITKPNEELITWCTNHKQLASYREMLGSRKVRSVEYKPADNEPLYNTKKSESHNYRYECPECHAVARSSKKIDIICGKCGVAFIGGCNNNGKNKCDISLEVMDRIKHLGDECDFEEFYKSVLGEEFLRL